MATTMTTNTTAETAVTTDNINPFEMIKEVPGVRLSTTANAIKTAREAFTKAGVTIPRTKDGKMPSDELICAMATAANVSKQVDDGMTRIAYLVGASVYSGEWASLYPFIKKDGEMIQRNKPFKSAAEFMNYMIPNAAASTAFNYVAAVTQVLIPAKMGKFPELPECAEMSVGLASNIKSALNNEELKPYLVAAVNELHKAKGKKDKPLTRTEWKAAIDTAKDKKDKAEKVSSNGQVTENVEGLNAEETIITPAATPAYYAMLAMFGATSGEQVTTLSLNADNVNKFRALVNNVYNGNTSDAANFVTALAGVLNGMKPEQ